MKTLFKILFVLFIISSAVQSGVAQSTKSEKKAAKEAAIKELVNSKNFIFKANYMYPLGGGQIYLTTDYDLAVGKDTLAAFLPYYGVAYSGVGYNNSDDNGIKFTSTKFDYVTEENKKGNWRINIKPKDTRTTNQMVLTIEANGNANLSVISYNRQSISFNGIIKEKPKSK